MEIFSSDPLKYKRKRKIYLMRKCIATLLKNFVFLYFFSTSTIYGVERIFSEFYFVKKGDHLEKIINKKIWYENLNEEEKRHVIKNIKKWNPQIRNWKLLSLGKKLYLEFPTKWSKNLPIIFNPKKVATKVRPPKKDLALRLSKRTPQSKNLVKKEEGQFFKKVPYEIDIYLGAKLYQFTDSLTQSGDKISAIPAQFNMNFSLLYPLKTNLKFYFNFGVDYTSEQTCDPSAAVGFCLQAYVYKIPLDYILKSGLKRTLFSSTFNKGFSAILEVEREEFSYGTLSKATAKDVLGIKDAGPYIFPNKSTFLWLTGGLEYNFSIWNKASSLGIYGSYSLSGDSQLQASTGHWEKLSGFKIKGEYRQYLTQKLWLNLYYQILNFSGKYDFTSTHQGLNIGYTF